MQKTILLTGATDGIGLETARMLVAEGHRVLLHGRNRQKLENVEQALSEVTGDGQVESYVADLSRMAQVEALAKAVIEKHDKLDVLINNAGIFKTPILLINSVWRIRLETSYPLSRTMHS